MSTSLDGITFQAISCAAPAAFSGGNWPVVLEHGLANAPRVVLVGVVSDHAGSVSTAWGSAIPSWKLDAKGRVVITRIDGLSPGRSYRLTFVILA